MIFLTTKKKEKITMKKQMKIKSIVLSLLIFTPWITHSMEPEVTQEAGKKERPRRFYFKEGEQQLKYNLDKDTVILTDKTNTERYRLKNLPLDVHGHNIVAGLDNQMLIVYTSWNDI
jgi:hypothetical protein